jgi:hypothetical protein
VAESKNSKKSGRCGLPSDVPRESGADDGETAPHLAEIVDDAILRQLDRTFVSAFNAFWWLTMYELASSLLYANLLNRLLGHVRRPVAEIVQCGPRAATA